MKTSLVSLGSVFTLALALLATAGCESRVSLGTRCNADTECGGRTCRFGRCREDCTSASDCTEAGAFCIGAAGQGVCTVPTADLCTAGCGELRCGEGGFCSTPCVESAGDCLEGSRCGGAGVCVADAVAGDAGALDAGLDVGRSVDASLDAAIDASVVPAEHRHLCVGEGHACVVRAGNVYCWGVNVTGALGDGSNTGTVGAATHGPCNQPEFDCATTPRDPVNLHASGSPLENVVEVSCGASHACAIDASGVAYCWGSVGDGGLGHDALGWAAEPVVGLAGFHADHLRSGRFHTCAHDDALGRWRCWGPNRAGSNENDDRLGTGGTSIDDASYAAIDSPAFDGAYELAGGGFFTCAAFGAGDVACRGVNEAEVIAPFDATGEPHYVPAGATIAGTSGPQVLAAGVVHACALAGGVVSCWGAGGEGQLATVAPICPETGITGRCRADAQPIDDPMSRRFVGLWSGCDTGNTSCAITERGEVVCWGSNARGLAGHDPVTTRVFAAETAVPTLGGIVEVAVGDASACARDGSDRVFCWGANGDGQLGCGMTDLDDHPMPCEVSFP